MSFIEELMQLVNDLKKEIEFAGALKLEALRILLGCCAKCGVKLPENCPSYHCVPDCESHLADPCKEQEL